MGKKHESVICSNRRVLIVGTISNVATKLLADFSSVKNSFSTDFEVFTFLVESDSVDETLPLLSKLSRLNGNFFYESLGDLRYSLTDRVERIRYCRNYYVKYIRDNFENFKWDYIVVADLDGMNGALNQKAVRSCFSRLDWDCCLSNQTVGYYDIFALRERKWQPFNYFEDVEAQRSKYSEIKFSKFNFLKRVQLILLEDSIKRKAIYSKMRRIPRNSGWISVDSGFGGLAIYKPHVFLHFDYSKINNVSQDSEHVDLHLKMRENDQNIFINPKLINSHWNTYNINKFFFVRQVRRMVWGNQILYNFVKRIKIFLANN